MVLRVSLAADLQSHYDLDDNTAVNLHDDRRYVNVVQVVLLHYVALGTQLSDTHTRSSIVVKITTLKIILGWLVERINSEPSLSSELRLAYIPIIVYQLI